jgi:2-methylcitrate dehydratase PrpD
VNLAAGNLEGARGGGQSLREGGAVRNALLAVALARQGMRGGETSLEGEAGFYHSYTGNNQGKLSYVFTGPKTAPLDGIAAGLGERWYFLETLYRIYSIAGYDLAHVDVTAALCQERGIAPEQIDRIETVVNWIETLYPSPAFPTPGREGPRPGSTHYYAAWGATQGRFPLLKAAPSDDDPPIVLDLMRRVTLVPSKRQPVFAPTVTVYTKDGRKHTRRSTGREFIWDFDEEVRRLADIGPALPIPESRWRRLIEACRKLEDLPKASEVVRLTVARKKS